MEQSERLYMPLFSIRIVKDLTGLTPRQIRYYETHGFVTPTRTEGNQRLFSFADVDRLLDIKQLTERGMNMSDIKEVRQERQEKKRKKDRDKTGAKSLHEQLRWEVLTNAHAHKPSMIQGQIAHFFH